MFMVFHSTKGRRPFLVALFAILLVAGLALLAASGGR